MQIDYNRVNAIAKVFKDLGINGIKVFEDLDPQYQAIKEAVSRCRTDFLQLAFYANALNAYMLRMNGERFWGKYSELLIEYCNRLTDRKSVMKFVEWFTREFNSYAYNYKAKRLQKIEKCKEIEKLIQSRNYLELARETARCLETTMDAKTIAFAVKIAYYMHKAQGFDALLPFELPIPVDRRVAYISYTSGLISIRDVSTENIRDLIDIALRNAKTIRRAWHEISMISGIPALHIDAVVWYFGRFSNIGDATVLSFIDAVSKTLNARIGGDIIKKLARELFYKLYHTSS